MKRFCTTRLQEWQSRKNRRPLLIRGARQVGKTWLVREHGKRYQSFVEINLEASPQTLPIFKNNFGNPKELIKALSLIVGKKIEPQTTLLFIDEIQESKEALLSLRYFKEKLPELHVIAAGSLLEFAFDDLSFPVGRIEFFHLFPLNFFEFLEALGRSDVIAEIQTSFSKNKIDASVHEEFNKLFATYSLCGGMPEAVKIYCETKDWNEVQNITQILTASFREDFHKYSSQNNIDDLRILFDNVPKNLGQKFVYANIDPNIKSRELGNALNKLQKAGLVYKVHHSSCNGVPLAGQINLKKFKVFLVDIGLCHRLMGLRLSELYLKRHELFANQGALAEQIVAQEILSTTPENENPELFYWQREKRSAQAEVDLVFQDGNRIIPIEVKSNKGNRLKSLKIFLEEKNQFVSEGIKTSPQTYQNADKIKGIPLYAVSLLKRP
ncbi:MAG: ATP-binding protein [Deltaproteobacteria bacterium]|nr:ATP-binding protein [Deltaproteobacteria bacterium]